LRRLEGENAGIENNAGINKKYAGMKPFRGMIRMVG